MIQLFRYSHRKHVILAILFSLMIIFWKKLVYDKKLLVVIWKLETKQQVIAFLNETYIPLPVSAVNSEIYEETTITLSEVFAAALIHSSYFDKKTLSSFSSFCGQNAINFMDSRNGKQVRRKTNGSSFSRYWTLSVLKPEYQSNVVDRIIKYKQDYHQYIKDQKRRDGVFVGYVRKSPGAESNDTRKHLLTRMKENLESRSLVDKVFVSSSSSSSQRFADRDLHETAPVIDADGDTKGTLCYSLFKLK